MPRVTPAEFPRPRYDREITGATGVLAGTGLSVPTSRLWAFQLREATAGQRGTVVSPAFHGPGIIKDLSLQYAADGPGGTAMDLEIYQSISPGVNGNDQATLAVPPGVSIYELSYANDGGFAKPVFPGLMNGDQIGANGSLYHIINRVVSDDVYFLNVSQIARGAGAQVLNGLIRVYDRVPADLIADMIVQ